MANGNINDRIVIGGHRGTSTSNRYINVNDQSTGTLTGDNVDSTLAKADRLLAFSEKMVRNINSASVNNLISAGEINASLVYFEIYEIPVSVYIENQFAAGAMVDKITIYTAEVINKKITVIDETEFQDCIIAGWERSASDESAIEDQENKPNTFKVWFRFSQRKRTFKPFDQKGQAAGNIPSLINFPQGTLEASGGGGGDGGGGF